MRILMSGSSGLIGSSLKCRLIELNHEVIALVRKKSQDGIYWNVKENTIDTESMEDFDCLIHLAGENIATRWTEEKKAAIYKSRVDGTRLLVNGLSKLQRPPKIFASASAIGIYKERSTGTITEDSEQGSGFLAKVCQDWESETKKLGIPNIRVFNPRIGIVLSKNGGALQKMLMPFRMGLGGKLGDGSQFMPWIDIDDLVEAFIFCLENPIEGPVNFTAPHPVSQKNFAKALAEKLGRPAFFHMPEFLLKAAAGEMANELLLKSFPVIPKVLMDRGFQFRFPELKASLEHLLKS